MFLKLRFLLAFFVLAFLSEKALACHGLPIVNLQHVISSTSITITGESDAATNGCNDGDGYFMQVELICAGNDYTGIANYSSTAIYKPNASQDPYPPVVINFSNLCLGITYKWRVREFIDKVEGTVAEGPWSQSYTFTTPGQTPPLTLDVTANPNQVCPGQSSVLTASAGGGCGDFIYKWSHSLGDGPVKTPFPSATTTYSVEAIDKCTGNGILKSITVIVGGAANAGTATASPTNVCQGSSSTITLTGNNGTIQWQTSTNAGGLWTNVTGGTGTTLTLGPLSVNTWVRARITFCSSVATSNTVLVTVTKTPTITAKKDTTICSGGIASLVATPGQGGGSLIWSTGETTENISVSPTATTTYSAVYSVLNCPSAPANVTVTVNPTPSVDVRDTAVCMGQPATLKAMPSAPGGTFLWSTGATTSEITVNPINSTKYSVTYTLGGCTSKPDTATVTIKPIPTVNVPNITICETFSGTLSATGTPAGGTFLWSTTETSNQITVNPTSTQSYSVTYTLNGCSNTTNATITVTPKPVITLGDTLICSGSAVVLTPVVSASGGSYLWSTGSSTPTISVSPAAETTYSVTYSFSGCQSDPAISKISIKPTPVISVNNETICFGDSTLLFASSSLASGTYLWNPGNLTGNSIKVSPATTTQYTVQHTLNGCTGTGTGTVTVNFIPGVTAGPDVSICNGASTILTAGGANSYLWMPGGETTQSITVSPSDTTSYTVVGFINGCSGKDTVVVKVASPLILNASATDAKCFNSKDGILNVSVSGSLPPYTYNWNSGLFSSSYIDTVTAGTYTVIVTDNLNCSNSASVTINQPTILSATKSQINITCKNGNDGQASLTGVSGGTSPYLYNWNNTTPQTNTVLSNLTAGIHNVIVIDTNNCLLSIKFTLTEPDSVKLTLVPEPTICVGQSALLNVTPSGGTPGYQFNWSNYGFQPDSFITVSPVTSTNYTIQARDSKGCLSANRIIKVNVRKPLSVSITPSSESICEGDSTILRAQPSGGDSLAYNFAWMPGGLTTQSITVSPFSTTNYQVELKDGCSSSSANANVTITVNPLPVVNFTSNIQASCAPVRITFSDQSTISNGSITSWLWNTGNNDISYNKNFDYLGYNAAGSYDVTLRVESDSGCVGQLTIPDFITIHPNPKADFTTNQNTLIVDNTNVGFIDNSVGAVKWLWIFGEKGNGSQFQNPNFIYKEPGDYEVTLKVENEFTCKDSVVKILTIKPTLLVYIPNSFSPNGDGLNDVFIFKGANIEREDFELLIFNRWGEIIYKTNEIDKGWDGITNTGKEAPNGIYVYYIKLKEGGGKKRLYTGSVNLLK